MTAHKIGTDTAIPLAEYPTDAGTFFVLVLTFEQEGTYRFSLAASTEASLSMLRWPSR